MITVVQRLQVTQRALPEQKGQDLIPRLTNRTDLSILKTLPTMLLSTQGESKTVKRDQILRRTVT